MPRLLLGRLASLSEGESPWRPLATAAALWSGVTLLSACDAPPNFPSALRPDPGTAALSPGPPGSWDAQAVHAPSVVRREGRYLLWYDGTDGRDPYDGWAIGLASSPDGVSWERWQGNPVLRPGPPGSWDGRSVHDPRVLWDGRRYLMWYSGYDGVHWRVGLATSEDGLRWARFSGNPVLEPGLTGSWDESGVAYSSVLAQGGSYLMWYQGQDAAGRWRIGHAASLNGVQWFKSTENPVLGPGPPGAWDQERAFTPHVLPWGSGFLMLYGGGPGGRELGYAFSADGVRWRKALAGPALPVRQAGLAAPPDTRYLTVAALREGGGLVVWYGEGREERIAVRRAIAPAPALTR